MEYTREIINKMIKMAEAVAEVVVAVEAAAEEVAEVDVADAGVVEDNQVKIKTMKKLIIHLVPGVISFIWLFSKHHTFNPITLKGPDFLQFYSILLLSVYAVIPLLKMMKEPVSKTVLYGISLVFILGIIKLVRGLILGKPIGFLAMILLLECIVGMVFIRSCFKYKMK